MRDISSIIQQKTKLFLEHIKSFSDLSRVHHIAPKNGGFPVFMIDNREYYEQSFFDELIENSIWRYLVNGVFNALFNGDYCLNNTLSIDWQDMNLQLTSSYVEEIEERYFIEFAITRHEKREGYRYTNCYWLEEQMEAVFKNNSLDDLRIIEDRKSVV